MIKPHTQHTQTKLSKVKTFPKRWKKSGTFLRFHFENSGFISFPNTIIGWVPKHHWHRKENRHCHQNNQQNSHQPHKIQLEPAFAIRISQGIVVTTALRIRAGSLVSIRIFVEPLHIKENLTWMLQKLAQVRFGPIPTGCVDRWKLCCRGWWQKRIEEEKRVEEGELVSPTITRLEHVPPALMQSQGVDPVNAGTENRIKW